MSLWARARWGRQVHVHFAGRHKVVGMEEATTEGFKRKKELWKNKGGEVGKVRTASPTGRYGKREAYHTPVTSNRRIQHIATK